MHWQLAPGSEQGYGAATVSRASNGSLIIHRRHLLGALQLLLDARAYAGDCQRDIWDFAVEVSVLRRAGLTASEIRWLVCKDFVQHAREITHIGEESRSFRPDSKLTFSKRTCFVLTESGAHFARAVLEQAAATDGTNARPAHSSAVAPHGDEGIFIEPPAAVARTGQGGNGQHRDRSLDELPYWDCDYREVRFKGRVVKQFKLPSPNQETILMAFQEEGWPPRIDDPLPGDSECDPKQRLHDTIRSLNRNQKIRVLRFRGDGTGQGILWEPMRTDREDESGSDSDADGAE